MTDDAIEPLVTQCPGCRTRFRVTEAQLGMSKGRVRCGACLAVFRGADHLVLGLDETPATPMPVDVDAALDALLNELSEDSTRMRPPQTPEPPPVPRVVRELGPKRGRERRDSPRRGRPPGVRRPPGDERVRAAGGPRAAAREPSSSAVQDAVPVLVSSPEGATGAPSPSSSTLQEPSQAAPVAMPEPRAPAPATLRIDEPSSTRLDQSQATPEPVPQESSARAGIDETHAERPGPTAPPEPTPEANARREVKRRQPAKTPGSRAARTTETTLEELARVALHDLRVVEERPRRKWWLVAASAVAALLLGAQVLWLQFDAWGRDPQYRPLYQKLCAALGCRLPVMRAVDEFYVERLVVRSHESVPNALHVDALIVNGASFAQPFPILELRFSGLNGELVAARRLDPARYLAGELEGESEMPPNTPIHVSIAIEDPGPQAVNYLMAFR